MDITTKNIAETLSEVLPEASIVHQVETGVPFLTIAHAAVPKTSELKELKLDLEKYMPHPRRTVATARFSEPDSFLAYVAGHAVEGTVVWCTFDPQKFSLGFTAVFDEHTRAAAGWRSHKAIMVPEMSAEWKAWKEKDRAWFKQVPFAEWIQEHDVDIASGEGLPNSLQMLEMATNFVMNEELVLKSSVRLSSGGVRLTYIADPDSGTTEDMRIFEKFALGLPVFHGGSAWSVVARLKYRNDKGSVVFSYELIRADKVHEAAAKDVIQVVRDGLGAVPLLMGSVGE